MTLAYAVTFESERQGPRTIRGTVDGGTPGTAASRAIRQAQKAYPGIRWASLVLVFEKPQSSTVPGEAEGVPVVA